MAESKPFCVSLTRDASESCYVHVMAISPPEAERIAQEIAGKYGENVGPWVPDEGNLHDCYLADPGNCAEEVQWPVCVIRRPDRPQPIVIPMVWSEMVFTGGSSGDWHGFWVVPADCEHLKAFGREIITFNSVDGDRQGTSEDDIGPFSWEILGDPSQLPE